MTHYVVRGDVIPAGEMRVVASDPIEAGDAVIMEVATRRLIDCDDIGDLHGAELRVYTVEQIDRWGEDGPPDDAGVPLIVEASMVLQWACREGDYMVTHHG